jgi:hypothetical protein
MLDSLAAVFGARGDRDHTKFGENWKRSIHEARGDLIEALTLFFECADPAESHRRFKLEVLVTQVEVKVS